MKLIFKMFLILVTITVVTEACKWNDAGPTVDSYPQDTVITSIKYMVDWRRNLYETGTAEKTWRMVLKPDPKDSTRNIKQLDSFYRLAIFQETRDTIKKDSPVISLPRLDSFGLPLRRFLGMRPIEKRFILKDYNVELK